jgi:hypothetical protein
MGSLAPPLGSIAILLPLPDAAFVALGPQMHHTWTDNEVRELIALKLLHISLLNITVVSFKVLALGSYAPIPEPSTPFERILELVLWNGLHYS